MKIGIELNHIVRDVNSQMLKYFKKDIQKDFDDKDVDLNVSNFIETLPFKTKKQKNDFLYVDYPYEIFGCARTKHRNLANSITQWEIDMNNKDNGEKYELVHFSLKENALTIQSSYYFLSKIGSRVRETYFPTDGKDMWKVCDVIITTDSRIIKNKPENKVCVLIRTNDNENLEEYADLVYDNILEVISDDDFLLKVESSRASKKPSIVSKFTKKIKNIFNYGN